MLDVSAEHTEENHATFRKFRDFYLIESRKNVRIKTKQEKDFLKFFVYGKLCFWKILSKTLSTEIRELQKKVKVFLELRMVYLIWGRHWYWLNIYFLPFLNLLMNIILEKCTLRLSCRYATFSRLRSPKGEAEILMPI